MKPVPPVTRTGRSASCMLAPFLDQVTGETTVAPRGDVGERLGSLRPLPELGQLGRPGELGQKVRRGPLPRLYASQRDRFEEADVAPAPGESVGEDVVDGI